MFVLKVIAIILNIIFAMLVGYFLSSLDWRNEDDRMSIIVFWMMLAVYMLNMVLLMFM